MKNVEVTNTGLVKRASVHFSRRGVHYTVESTSSMQNVSRAVPEVRAEVIRWETRSRLSGVVLSDDSEFQKQRDLVVDKGTMTASEVEKAKMIQRRAMLSFAECFA